MASAFNRPANTFIEQNCQISEEQSFNEISLLQYFPYQFETKVPAFQSKKLVGKMHKMAERSINWWGKCVYRFDKVLQHL